MQLQLQPKLVACLVLAAMIFIAPTTAALRAAEPNRPMQSHDFVDVPVAGKEFMEPFIDAFFHQGITGGCSTSPLMYCPEDPVTRGSLAVFMGRALGYAAMVDDSVDARAYFKGSTAFEIGVIGRSTNAPGVYGFSTENYGIEGESINGSGVRAQSATGYALSATSSTNGGVFARGGTTGADTSLDTVHDIDLGGLQGEIASPFGPFLIESVTDIFLDLDYDNNDAQSAVFRVRNGAKAHVFLVNESGDMFAAGTKSAFVDTVSHGTRAMYAVEATEVLFEDVGSAELVDGEAVIEIDPIFAETVNLEEEYQVFLTPVGSPTLIYVVEKTATEVVVRSADGSDLRFDYRIVAKRLGYEDVRMEEVED